MSALVGPPDVTVTVVSGQRGNVAPVLTRNVYGMAASVRP